MKSKQFKKIAEILVAGVPGLVVQDKMILLAPFSFTVCGFQFDSSAFSKANFYVNIFFVPLSVPTDHLHLAFSRRIGRRNGWTTEEPDVALCLKGKVLESLPFLRTLDNFDELADALRQFAQPNQKGLVNPLSYEALAYTLIEGQQIEDALQVIQTVKPKIQRANKWHVQTAARLAEVETALRIAPVVAQNQISTWRSENIERLGLEPLVRAGSGD